MARIAGPPLCSVSALGWQQPDPRDPAAADRRRVQARLGEALAQCQALITRAPADQMASNAAARITGDRCAHREPRREIADLIGVSVAADEGALGDQAWRESTVAVTNRPLTTPL